MDKQIAELNSMLATVIEQNTNLEKEVASLKSNLALQKWINRESKNRANLHNKIIAFVVVILNISIVSEKTSKMFAVAITIKDFFLLHTVYSYFEMTSHTLFACSTSLFSKSSIIIFHISCGVVNYLQKTEMYV